MALDVQELFTKSREQLDELFRNAESGPIPDGAAKGTALIAPGTAFSDDPPALACPAKPTIPATAAAWKARLKDR